MADDEAQKRRLDELCTVQPGDTPLMLKVREMARAIRDLGATDGERIAVIRDNIRLEAAFVNLRHAIDELLSNEREG